MNKPPHAVLRDVAVAFAVVILSTAGLIFAVATVQQAQNRDAALVRSDDRGKAMLAELRDLREQVDVLADQNAGLADLLRDAGVNVPASLVTRNSRSTRIVERTDDDSDDSTPSTRGSDRQSDPKATTPPQSPRPSPSQTTTNPVEDLTEEIEKNVDGLTRRVAPSQSPAPVPELIGDLLP